MKVICKQCKTSCEKQPGEIKKNKNVFCSRSCAASFNNKKYPKRGVAKVYQCKDCSKQVTNHTYIRCQKCKRKHTLSVFNKRTIGDTLYAKADSSLKFNQIRARARTVLELAEIPKECHDCGWDKHVQVAHLKPLSSFAMTALVGEANSLDNLQYLCPNCHWILDNPNQ